MIEFPFVLGRGGRLPTRGYEDDAGLDLYVSEGFVVEPGEFVDVPTSVSGQLPAGHWGLLTGRSSTLRHHSLMVVQGVIDTGYRGELFVGVINFGHTQQRVEAGTRLAQLILIEVPQGVQPVQVNQLDRSSRGDAGFGSTGH